MRDKDWNFPDVNMILKTEINPFPIVENITLFGKNNSPIRLL